MILITGASSGIGEACARELAPTGEGLLLLARRKDKLEALAKELGKYGPVEVASVDVSKRSSVEKFASDQSALLSKVRVLINNAGLARGIDPIQDGSLDAWDEVIDTNLKGFLYITHALLPHLRKQPHAHVVNLGSVAADHTYPKGNVYCASKAAVKALSQSLRVDLLGSGIRVSEIRPGMVETEFSVVRLGDTEKARAVYAGMTPLTGKDIAETVAWCLNRPRHVNIQEVVIYPTDQASPTQVHRK
jgi:NADP-dependent 3-hydroxy acid dehydrogenase YdfG